VSTRLSDYDYPLPEHLIALYPPARRGDSRLLVVHRATQTWEDRMFGDIIDYLDAGDVLVLNKTKVIPARLIGRRVTTGAEIELLLLQRFEGAGEITHDLTERWKALARPGKKAKEGEEISFGDLTCVVEQDLGEGEKIVHFNYAGEAFWRMLDTTGQMPLPPYIHRPAEASDKERYQTVFAEVPGAVAAPTAGLHFTPELLAAIESKGVRRAHVTLHTGLGTFRPVQSEDITEHRMHEEYYELDEADALAINTAKQNGRRVVAVGTTTVRTLETLAQKVAWGSGMSGIFIYPPYQFRVPDAIITNFHLPRSTLQMMISAFMGREFLLECYRHAIEAEYRFFSYGDAMLIL
jgi:S-adenosylmethionine:tRNA ribosyltransferase-isomerase